MNYGDRRIETTVKGVSTYAACDAETFPLDLALAAAKGLPPFSIVVVQECRSSGPHPLFRDLVHVETRPAPGWAAKGAQWCATCGAVSHVGNAPTCGH